MPTYDYRCTNCGDIFEHFQKMTDAPLTKCNKCGGELKRLIGAGLGPIFKGSGFYQTDYKKSSVASTSSSTSDNSKKESKDSSKDTKSDSKKNPA